LTYSKRFSSPEMVPENLPVKRVFDQLEEYYGGRQAGLRAGGLTNGLSGAGGLNDKAMYFQFIPFWLNSKPFIENVKINSWVADRFISMPIDDMFTEPRVYDDERFKEEADRLGLEKKLAATMRLGRQFGTGLLWVVTKEADQAEPLDVDRIRPGDVVNLITVDRYDVSIVSRNNNVLDLNMGQPEWYRIHLHDVGTFVVHASRTYRFEGLTSDSNNRWSQFSKDWGISNLAHAMVEIFNDASTAQAITHMVQESSIPVQKIDGLAEILCSGALEDEMSVEQRMQQVSMYKSIYRTLFMDSKDEFERVGINFSNVPDLMEKFSERLAMAAGISATRFLGKSPDGQNSTGQGDMRNDNRTTAARQEHSLRPVYNWIDPIIAKSAGAEVPEYTFPPLFEPTQKEEAEVSELRSKTAEKMMTNAAWDEDESREYLATGVLPTGTAPDMEEEELPDLDLDFEALEV